MNRHNKFSHLRQKKFVCTICDKALFTSSDLEKHKLVHTGEKSLSAPSAPRISHGQLSPEGTISPTQERNCE